MNEFAAYLPSAWFDEGLLVGAPRPQRRSGADAPNRATRRWDTTARKATFAFVAVGAAMVAGSLLFDASAIAGTAAVPMPAGARAVSVDEPDRRKHLADALQAIRRSGDDWNGVEMTKPAPKSMAAAEAILPQLPGRFSEATAGIDGDGNVYFRMQQGKKLAFITIAPPAMHVLYMEPGKENVYIDDERFKGKVLPARVKRLLNEKLA